MIGFKRTDEELRQLAKTWFAEVRQKSAQDEAEFAAWNKERRKWSPLGYSGGSDVFGSDSGSGDSGGGFG